MAKKWFVDQSRAQTGFVRLWVPALLDEGRPRAGNRGPSGLIAGKVVRSARWMIGEFVLRSYFGHQTDTGLPRGMSYFCLSYSLPVPTIP